MMRQHWATLVLTIYYSICAAVHCKCVFVCVYMHGLSMRVYMHGLIACTQLLCYGEWHAVWVDLQPGLNLLLRLWWAWWERGVKLLKEPTSHFSLLPLGPPLWVQTSLSTVVCSIRIQPRLPATIIHSVILTQWRCGCENPHQVCIDTIYSLFTHSLFTHQIATVWQACCYRLRYSLSYRAY